MLQLLKHGGCLEPRHGSVLHAPSGYGVQRALQLNFARYADRPKTMKDAEIEMLEAPLPRQRFQFWGQKARLVLPVGFPVVELEYLTEPPHGNPLYSLLIEGRVAGGYRNPIPLFGRDIHLSSCSRFLAMTSLKMRQDNSIAFHVVDIIHRRIWSEPGFVRIEAVSSESVWVSRATYDGSQCQYGEVALVPLREDAWTEYVRS